MCKVVTRFLAMPVCNIGTAQALFDAIESEFDSHSISWINVVSFASDTVWSRLHEKQPRVFTLGCLCHLAALCSVAGLKKLSVSIDVDIFYHFKHSAKKWTEYSHIIEEFDEIRPLRVLKHC